MSLSIGLAAQAELAATVAIDLDRVRKPQYGRYLDEFVPGQVFVHPRGFTFCRAAMLDFARTFLQANPLYLNLEYAKAHGFPDLPASPQLVFNVVLSLGVQNDSEKAMANLGYYDVQFLRSVYSGDTLRGFTMVEDRKERGGDKPGIATIRTLGVNQLDQVVLQYRRKIMVPPRGNRPAAAPAAAGAQARGEKSSARANAHHAVAGTSLIGAAVSCSRKTGDAASRTAASAPASGPAARRASR
jgi:2-methylfumaryl-CoA hydratase